MSPVPFAAHGVRGEAAESLAGEDPAALARRLLDPGVATATLHWGRNYIYRARLTADPDSPAVAVKQFRDPRPRAGGTSRAVRKAEKSFRMATAFAEASIPTPEPLLYAVVETGAASTSGFTAGTGIFVSRAIEGWTELRYPLRARNAGSERETFPTLDFEALVAAIAGLARRMHDAGLWHRDFSIGNLLLDLAAAPAAGGAPPLVLLDLNRCRKLARVPRTKRMRDLCRLPLDRADDRARLLGAYFAPESAVPWSARAFYESARRAFLARNRLKAGVRGLLARVKGWVVPRGTHAHIPPPPAGAAARDKIVWDALSDQPHSHASRLERARVRLADAPSHLASFAALAGAVPRIRRRYRELASAPVAEFPWPEPGVALRPWPHDPPALLAAFDELGARRALLRLHPWQANHDAEEALARELAARGVELAFALPQNRELVNDRQRWRAAIEELAERFAPLGSRFQIGQAVNRSKWGVWSHDEYLALAADAAGILRRPRPGVAPVELFGPAVIDFEAHVTAALVNRRHPDLRFDGLASLLYVDRRGAPENPQLGFDTADKVRLLAAIAATGRLVDSGRQWIPEVNWPLREGPHSPAGKSVSVDEAAQADYLPRFFLLATAAGHVERVDWWQLVARGYGLVDPGTAGELRRRPAFRAFATLRRELAGAVCLGPRETAPGLRAVAFRRGAEEVLAVWAPGAAVEWTPPGSVLRVVERDGVEGAPSGALRFSGAIRYLTISPPP
ncbi:MAG: lipopolysaccharide kinase InaA family protein [Thermoanaerobaculia bacterium]